MENDLQSFLKLTRDHVEQSSHDLDGVPTSGDTTLGELQLDSLGLLDLMMTLENAYELTLDVPQIRDETTLGEIYRMVCEQSAGSAG